MTHAVDNVRGHGLSDRLAGFFEAFKARRARNAIFRTTLRELNQLSERELADLGLHRSQIKQVAKEAAYDA